MSTNFADIFEAISGGINSFMTTRNELQRYQEQRASEAEQTARENQFRVRALELQQQGMTAEEAYHTAQLEAQHEALLSEERRSDAAAAEQRRQFDESMKFDREKLAAEQAANTAELKARYGVEGISDEVFKMRMDEFTNWQEAQRPLLDAVVAEKPEDAKALLGAYKSTEDDVRYLMLHQGMDAEQAEMMSQSAQLADMPVQAIGQAAEEGKKATRSEPGFREAVRRALPLIGAVPPWQTGKPTGADTKAITGGLEQFFLGRPLPEESTSGAATELQRLTRPPESTMSGSIQYSPGDTLSTGEPIDAAYKALQRRVRQRRQLNQ